MKKYLATKKHLLAVAAGLLTTAAVTATVISTHNPNPTHKKQPVKEIKCSHRTCTKTAMHVCPF